MVGKDSAGLDFFFFNCKGSLVVFLKYMYLSQLKYDKRYIFR